MKQELFFCNSNYLYDFIVKNHLSQKALHNATSIVFADIRQKKYIMYYFNMINSYCALGTILELAVYQRFDAITHYS